jgi:hypothetical protein
MTESPKAVAHSAVGANAGIASGESLAPRDTAAPGGLSITERFVREHWLRIAVVSAALLVPCFWHHEIEADDLGSHLYNAWLVQLIHRGELPGLWVAHPWTNVLFDYMLSGFGAAFGLHAGEKISVALAVLVFFWGAFAMVAAATRRSPWLIAPCIALAAYGWTFEMGLFNYYLSVGLAFWGLAIFWRGRGRDRLALLAIAPLSLLADPLGVIWLAGACAYIWLAESTERWLQALWFALAAAGLFIVPRILGAVCYQVDPATKPFYFFNGADQVSLFGPRYRIVEYGLIAFALIAIAIDLVVRWREQRWRVTGAWSEYAIPAEFYALAILSVWLLPDAVQVKALGAAAALLTERFTTISAVLACCLLGAMRPRKWHLAATAAIMALFFGLLWQHTGRINRMEAQIVQLVSKLPPGQRVMGSIYDQDSKRVLIQHILDRACIGRCFSYGNYEPSSLAFRVRARPGNRYVLTDNDEAISTEKGEYLVQPRDLPVYQIYECGYETLCIAALNAGEKNNAVAGDQ